MGYKTIFNLYRFEWKTETYNGILINLWDLKIVKTYVNLIKSKISWKRPRYFLNSWWWIVESRYFRTIFFLRSWRIWQPPSQNTEYWVVDFFTCAFLLMTKGLQRENVQRPQTPWDPKPKFLRLLTSAQQSWNRWEAGRRALLHIVMAARAVVGTITWPLNGNCN